jgi:hypothetical protein
MKRKSKVVYYIGGKPRYVSAKIAFTVRSCDRAAMRDGNPQTSKVARPRVFRPGEDKS